MSDFDKEAEREKLRKKYERDKEKREASEQMSELLLQGATMTNRHCPECHSPVFRYDGQEFCPTCRKEVSEDGELLDPETEHRASDAEASEAGASDAESVDGAAADATEAESVDATSADEADEPAESEDALELSEETSPTPAPDTRPARVQPPATRDSNVGTRRTDADEPLDTEDGTLRDAEARLIREIATLTRRVEETRDVGRKRDLLAAARDAAETLEAVRRL